MNPRGPLTLGLVALSAPAMVTVALLIRQAEIGHAQSGEPLRPVPLTTVSVAFDRTSYVRNQQADERLAWASPMWIDVEADSFEE